MNIDFHIRSCSKTSLGRTSVSCRERNMPRNICRENIPQAVTTRFASFNISKMSSFENAIAYLHQQTERKKLCLRPLSVNFERLFWSIHLSKEKLPSLKRLGSLLLMQYLVRRNLDRILLVDINLKNFARMA